MPKPKRPITTYGYGHLLESEIQKFRQSWHGPSPEESQDDFLMLFVHYPECVDAGERGAHAREGWRQIRELYPDFYVNAPAQQNYDAAVKFAGLYAAFPDFVAAWMEHGRRFLREKKDNVARHWLLTNPSTIRPGTIETVPVSKLTIGEICQAIERDTGVAIGQSTLRKVRDSIIDKPLKDINRSLSNIS
jgi:hypothetical protein